MSEGPASYFREKSIDLTGVSQPVFADVGYQGMEERFIANPSAANDIWINVFGGVAAPNAKGSFRLAPGGYYAVKTPGLVNVIGTAGQAATAGER